MEIYPLILPTLLLAIVPVLAPPPVPDSEPSQRPVTILKLDIPDHPEPDSDTLAVLRSRAPTPERKSDDLGKTLYPINSLRLDRTRFARRDEQATPMFRAYTLIEFPFEVAMEMAKELLSRIIVDIVGEGPSARPSIHYKPPRVDVRDLDAKHQVFHYLFQEVERHAVGDVVGGRDSKCTWNLRESTPTTKGVEEISGNSMMDAVRITYLSLFVLTAVDASMNFHLTTWLKKEGRRLGK